MTYKKRIIFAFCISIVILAFLAVYSYVKTNRYKNASEWVSHNQEVMSQAQYLLSNIQDIEISQRGYVITSNAKDLETYTAGLKNIGIHYIQLKKLIKNDSAQLNLIDSIYKLTVSKVVFVNKVLSIRDEQGFMAAQALMNSGVGRNMMKEIRLKVGIFIANEKTSHGLKLTEAKKNFIQTERTIIASISITILVLLVTFYFFIRDYDKRLASERKVIESELRIQNFLDALPLGVFIIRADGKPFYANRKSRDLLGKGIMPENMPEKSMEDLAEIYKVYVAGSNDFYPEERQPLIRALRGEQNVQVDDMEILRDGVRIPLRINATSVADATGKIEFGISVFEDVTEIKESERNLITARQLAEESVIIKETFLANMSHEIRTPMNAIIGFTNLLMKRDLGSQENDYVRTIKTSGENLLRIINDILDVSKMKSNMMNFEEHPLSVRELLNSLNTMLLHTAREKNLQLTFECAKNIPDVMLGDPTRLTQIIINLVGNAIKFTNKGRIDVFAKLLNEDEETYTLAFSVKDTGIGIPEDKVQHIFERFTQAESHTTRSYGGTGLGLSIAKQLVELQGGHIKIESIVGLGSNFSFTLSFKKAPDAINTVRSARDNVDFKVLRELNILVVDDNPINIKFVISLFSEYDMKADVAENGKQAVEKTQSKNYDLVLMDIEMPEMNGYEATNTIRNVLKSNIPIIAMTAHALAGEREKCLQLGMNDYITKPINSDLLFEKIQNVVSDNKVNNSNSNKLERLTDLTFLIKAMRNNKDIIRETIDIFLKQVPEDLLIINEAVEKTEYANVKRFSHRMKSTVSMIGASGIELILEEMEVLGADGKGIEKIKSLAHSMNGMCKQAMAEIQADRLKYI